MPHLAFCANCGSERLDIIAGGRSIQIRCYVCTKTSDVSGVILGEVDFLAGAQAKVEAMIAKAKERASKAANRRDSAQASDGLNKDALVRILSTPDTPLAAALSLPRPLTWPPVIPSGFARVVADLRREPSQACDRRSL